MADQGSLRADKKPPQQDGPKRFPAVLPEDVDLAGRRDERPTGKRFVWLAASVLALLLLSDWFILHASMGAAVLCGVAALALVVIPGVCAYRFLTQYLGPWKADALSQEERIALEYKGDEALALRAQRVQRAGSLLGRTEDEQPTGSASVLTSEEVAVLDAHRARETRATLDWLDAAEDPVSVRIAASDEARLVGHVFACAPSSRRWVVLVHDFEGDWTDALLHVRRYAERGFNVLVPELRAHHQSEGAYIGMGLLDAMDLVLWCRWIVRDMDEGARIVLHGQGMGAAAVCMAAAEKTLPSGVVAAVSDSGYSDAWNVILRGLRAMRLPAHLVLDVARLVLKLSPGGYDVASCDPAAAVVHAQVPMLYLQGEEDLVVPAYMGKRLYDATSGSAAGENKRLCMFRHAGHNSACFADPARYYHEVFAFVEPRC
jgi:alpha-beta hydrolase superfamily lysophospholipase